MYDSVADYLESQKFGRPQTWKEITLQVSKNKYNSLMELRRMIRRKEVSVVVVHFGDKDLEMYSLREDVTAAVEDGPGMVTA